VKALPLLEPSAPSEVGERPDARYRVEGMDCGSCARTLERVVGGVDGVRSARVSFGSASMELWGDAREESVLAAVARAGFSARPAATRPRVATDVPFWRRDPRAVSTCFAILILAVAVIASLVSAPRQVAEPLYLASMIVGGWPVARSAAAALRRRSLDMNVLMALAAIGAVGVGAYAEGAWVLELFALGTTLETFALDHTRRSVAALADLAPEEARIVEHGVERLVPVDEVAVGTLIVVRPGERLPLDGVIESGVSSLDESPINGESVPADRGAGDTVYAGALNQLGALVVRTTKVAADSTIARIVELVEQAQGSRAPSERLVDRFARIYTPLVVAAALLVATVPALFGADASTWIYRALALLIVACPCSLVISIPVAVISAIGAAARNGVLIKGGEALENLSRIRVVTLDKTGTLTAGTPQLATIRTLDALDDDEALRLIASLERHSEHPLAAALVRAAADRGITLADADELTALPGRGIDARLDGRALWAGGPRLAAERLMATLPPSVAELEAAGETVILLGEADHPLAAFGLRDEPRPEAAAAIVALRRSGAERIVMLTGDNDAVARSVAERVGIDEVHASLLPDEKLARVRALEETTGSVAMVGDGINDAPALAAARIGVAMGAAGSAIALDSANVALMGDDLSRLPMALALARRAVRIMRQNVVASLLVKGFVVVLVPFGLVTLWMAVAADMGMSLLVTLNGLRLLRTDRAALRVGDTSAVNATRIVPSESCSCCAPAVASGTEAGNAIPPVALAPSGCTLDAAALSEREHEFRELFARALRRVERHDARSARLVLDAACEAEARDLFAREQECCSFFDFTLAVVDEALVVDVQVPSESEALAFLLALAPLPPVRSR
jgi:Cd2+/Zn2+-exporting ATPase